jgi:hypothetical protein
MYDFIVDRGLKNMAPKAILKEFCEEFGVDSDYISSSRISQIKSKAKKAKRGRRKTQPPVIAESVPIKPVTAIELEEMEETVSVAKDLKTVLADAKIPKSKIESIYYGFENHPEPDAWALLQFLSINGISPSVQRIIILNYFGLDTVKEIWPSSKHSTLKKVVEDPTTTVNEIQQNRIKKLKGDIALEHLKDAWDDISDKNKKSDDPFVADLKSQVEELKLKRQVNLLKKEEKQQDDSFLNTVKGLKELGMVGNNNKSAESSVLVQTLQTQNQYLQKQIEDSRRSLEEIRANSTQQQINSLETRMSLELRAIQEKAMSAEEWDIMQQNRHRWAEKHGYAKDNDTEADKSLKRLDRFGERIEKSPDKLSEAFDKSVDKVMNTFDKLSQIQERRRLQEQRRQHRQQLQLRGGNIPIPNPSQQHPNEFLDSLESQIDEQKRWKELQKKGDTIDPKKKRKPIEYEKFA